MTTRNSSRHTRTIPCRTCRARLPHYANGELRGRLKAQVSAHLDTCDACYREFRAHRAAAGEYRAALPQVGRPDAPQMTRMWAGVQHDLRAPSRARPLRERLHTLAMVVVLVSVLALSGFAGGERIARALPNPPTPNEQNASTAVQETEAVRTDSAAPRAVPTQVADAGSLAEPTAALTLPSQPNYAPQINAAATQAP